MLDGVTPMDLGVIWRKTSVQSKFTPTSYRMIDVVFLEKDEDPGVLKSSRLNAPT